MPRTIFEANPLGVSVAIHADGAMAAAEGSLLWASAAYFMSRLKDDRGDPLLVVVHNETWITLMQYNRLLALMAPRDHSKTFTSRSYMLWRMWRHNRGPDGVLYNDRREGKLEIVLFSSNMEIAQNALFAGVQDMILDNLDLFSDLLPPNAGSTGNPDWSKSVLRLRNGVVLVPKAIGSATRGLHPDLIIVDDILSDKNSLTALQRGRVWAYLLGTIGPMVGPEGQLIVIGTAQHYEDALHRLRRDKRFVWRKFRAVNWDTGKVLWEGRHNLADLQAIRDADPVIFSKEYQNDPRDDASSLFPLTLTARPVERGMGMRFESEMPMTNRVLGEFVVGALDVAISEAVGADYTDCKVALYNRFTAQRRLLWAMRERGLTFDDQVTLMRDVCRRFNVDIMVIEQNVAQKWLLQHLVKYPETASRVYGHTTGIEKQNLTDGVPGMKIVLQNDLWTWPSGEDANGNVIDPEARDYVRTMRMELNAFGFVDGKLQGVGEHDDTVLGLWLTERAIRMIEALPEMPGTSDYTAEEVGIGERVTITKDY